MLLEIWSFLSAWYNLPFTALLGLSLLLVALQLGGLGGDGEHDADHDAGDLDHDLDQDLDHDMDHDVDHGADHDTDHDAGDAHADSFSLLAFVGVGKIPLMLVLLILFASSGLIGWLLNGVVSGIIGSFPGLLILVNLPVALLAGALFTSRITRFIGQMVPPLTTTASRAQALIGMTGTVTSPFVDEKYGMVHLRDLGSTLISVFAVTDDPQPISRGEQVLLVSYDAAERRYRVTRK